MVKPIAADTHRAGSPLGTIYVGRLSIVVAIVLAVIGADSAQLNT